MEGVNYDPYQVRPDQCIYKAAKAITRPLIVKATLPGVKRFVKKFQLPEPPTINSLTNAIFNQVPFLAEEEIIISFVDSEEDNVIISTDDELKNAVNEFRETRKQGFFRITVEIPRKPKPPPPVKEKASNPVIPPKKGSSKGKGEKVQRLNYKNLETLSNSEVLDMRSNLKSHEGGKASGSRDDGNGGKGADKKKSKKSRRTKQLEETFSEIYNDPDSDCILSEDEDTKYNKVGEESEEEPEPARCENNVSFQPIHSSMHGVGNGWNVTGHEPAAQQHPFSSHVGLKKDLRGKSILDIFFSVFTMDVIDFIIRETNRYRSQHPPNISSTSHMAPWTDLTRSDLLLFVTLLGISGHHSMERMKDYWTKKYFLEYPFFRSCMSRDRFFSILSYLHFCDNNYPPDPTSPWYDRAWKIRPVLNMLIAQFQSLYDPEEHLLIDQFVVKFKGRVVFSQHIPKQKHQGVLKLWKICDSRSYTYDLLLYTEQDRAMVENVLVPHKLVIDLAKTLRDKGHTVVTDNYFTSPSLFRELCAMGFNAVGTVKPTCKGMPELLNVNLKEGEVRYRRNYVLLAMALHNKKEVNILSTFHTGQRDGVYLTNNETIADPACLTYHDKYTRSMDKTNRVIAHHAYVRKAWKWTKKFFFHLLDLSIMNVYVLHGLADGASQKLSVREFRLALIEQLLEVLKCSNPRPATMSSVVAPTNADRLDSAELNHWPEYNVQKTNNPHQRRSMTCAVCKTKGSRKQSNIRCQECKVTLCPQPCFENYHTLFDY